MLIVEQRLLNVQPINWVGIPRRYMNPGELEVLVALVKSVRPERMIEFGVNEGRTAKVILREVYGILDYVGIDVMPGYVPSKKVQRDEVPEQPGKLVHGNPFFHLVLRPRGSLDITADELPYVDAVFIDGDHGYDAVSHDTTLAFARCKPGGIIIWHDYHTLGTVDVKDALDKMSEKGFPIKHVEGTWLAFMRMPQPQPQVQT